MAGQHVRDNKKGGLAAIGNGNIFCTEPYSPLFIEEPVLSEHLQAMADLRRQTHVPIATGERLFSRFDFKDLFTLGAADIIQPDWSKAGASR